MPRLLSTNSPPRCSVCGSTTSTLLAVCNPPVIPVTTITVIMIASIAAMRMTQCFSVRFTASSGTMPSGSGRRSGFDAGLANGTSRQKEEEIKANQPIKSRPTALAETSNAPRGPFFSIAAAASAATAASGWAAAELCGSVAISMLAERQC